MMTDTQLAEGVSLWHTYDAAKTAQRNSYLFPAAAEQLAADPHQAELLSAFGMRLLPAAVRGTHDRTRQTTIWQVTTPFTSFWTDMLSGIRAQITTTALTNGQVQQHLDTGAAWTIWRELRATLWSTHARSIYGPNAAPAPTDDQFPLHLAAILASFGGIAWHVADDGTSVERLLPNQPLRLMPEGQPAPPNGELKNKLLFPCVGWAYLPANSAANDEGEHALVYLSAVGPHKKLKAVWAALVDNKRDVLVLPNGHQYVRARRPAGKGVYDTYWNEEPLPESGLAHLAMHHRSMLHPRAGQPFLHLTGEDGLPDLALFQQQLDAASTFPVQPGWASALWDAALDADLITRLPSYGCAAYWAHVADEAAWGDLIARCAGATTATIHTYGDDPADAPQVAEVETAA